MTLSTAMTYLFSEEMLDLSYIISPSVRDEEVVVGFFTCDARGHPQKHSHFS